MKNWKKIILWACFILYLVLTLTVLFFHEPWQDELHTWVLARELNVFQIIYWMRYDGHFALWHLILHPFAATGMPLATLNLIAWLLCVSGVGLLLFRTKLPPWVRIAVLFSCPLFFYCPVVARPYCLVPLALYFLTVLYPVRLRHPFRYAFAILFLLYIHSYLAGMAGMLGLFFLFDLIRHTRKMPWSLRLQKIALPPLVMLLGALAAFLMVLPAVGESTVVPKTFRDFFRQDLWSGVKAALSALPAQRHAPGLANRIGAPAVTVLYWLALAAGLIPLLRRGRRTIFWCWFGGMAWMLILSALVYPMLMHRAYLPFLFLFFCLNLLPEKTVRNHPERRIRWISGTAVALLALMTYADSWSFFTNDLTRPFSNQGQMAMFIEQNIPKDEKIVTFPADLISSTLTAYLPDHRFYSCETNRRYRVYQRKGRIPAVLNDAVLRYYSEGNKDFYLMFNNEWIRFYQLTPEKLARGFRHFRVEFLYQTEPHAFFPAREDYCIFKVTPLE